MATATRPSPPIEARPAHRPDPGDFAPPPPGLEHFEVVDGEYVEIPHMGARQAGIANLLAILINQHAWPGGLGAAFVEILFRLGPGRKLGRKPDVAFVSAAKWPIDEPLPDTVAWAMVPDLAVEVVSPTDLAGDLNRKVNEYFRAGTATVWVVYTGTRQVYAYTSPTDVRILTPPAELDGGELLPGLRIPLARLFGDEEDDADAEDTEAPEEHDS